MSKHPYIPKGIEQQGRWPGPMHCPRCNLVATVGNCDCFPARTSEFLEETAPKRTGRPRPLRRFGRWSLQNKQRGQTLLWGALLAGALLLAQYWDRVAGLIP